MIRLFRLMIFMGGIVIGVGVAVTNYAWSGSDIMVLVLTSAFVYLGVEGAVRPRRG